MIIYQVDAFTNQPFSGNPAGVCLLETPKEEHWMQNIAREMNASETAFLMKENDGYRLRWFTPEEEVDLCGHATLAAAHILWETNTLPAGAPAKFFTHSGLLTAIQKGPWIELNFPNEAPENVVEPPGLLEGLKAAAKYVGKNRMDYLVEVESEEVVKTMKPDFTILQKIKTRGIIVTSIGSQNFDFVSRFFCPGLGMNEDPVTGSAHCCLGPYWQQRLNKDYFTAYQASARGGVLKVRVTDERVYLEGQAVTVFQAKFY
jgi:predicted PhzF superfamily epimerase YddE/YHI9